MDDLNKISFKTEDTFRKVGTGVGLILYLIVFAILIDPMLDLSSYSIFVNTDYYKIWEKLIDPTNKYDLLYICVGVSCISAGTAGAEFLFFSRIYAVYRKLTNEADRIGLRKRLKQCAYNAFAFVGFSVMGIVTLALLGEARIKMVIYYWFR